jgi:uncharacterized protein YkwD
MTPRHIVIVPLVYSAVLVGSCTGGATAPNSSSSSSSTAATAADLSFCVQETNRYRASVGLGALSQSAALESYAATGAQVDGRAHVAHSHFTNTSGGGVALAENVIPWWPLADYGTVQEVMRQGLAQMWAEGQSGVHYKNITGRYTQLGCGVFVDNGEITVVQDFR